jgi:excisionase family DNA binding protein
VGESERRPGFPVEIAKSGLADDFACNPVENRIQEVLTKELQAIHGMEIAMAGSAEEQAVLREVMDIRQAAGYLGISGDTLYRYASEGFVPAFKLGNRWRFRKSLLDNWMDEKSGVPVAVAEVDPAKKKPVGRAR